MIEQLLLSTHRALLFNIISSVRFIFIHEKENRIVLDIYSDRELTDDEKDMYYAVSGEISGDFPTINDSLNEVFFIVENRKIERIMNDGHLVNARFENIS